MWVHSKSSQAALSPDQAIEFLKKGNERFVQNLRMQRDLLRQVNATSEGQYPFAVILSCMDARTSAELIFDQGLGDVFSIRIAGNVVNDDILGSLEYACQIAGSKVVVVMGHTHCAAIRQACINRSFEHFTPLLLKIRPSVEHVSRQMPELAPKALDPIFTDAVARQHVQRSLKEIRRQSSILRHMEQLQQIRLVGAMYSVETGVVDFFY